MHQTIIPWIVCKGCYEINILGKKKQKNIIGNNKSENKFSTNLIRHLFLRVPIVALRIRIEVLFFLSLSYNKTNDYYINFGL